MEMVKQTDYKHIPESGCLLFCLLAGPQRFFKTSLAFHKIAYAYHHLKEQGIIRADCFVNNHAPVGSLACSLVIKPEYEVLFLGKKDLVTPKDSWGNFNNPSFTILHGITERGGHHFRLGDMLSREVWDPHDPPPRIIGESSIRYYRIQLRPAQEKEGWRDAGVSA